MKYFKYLSLLISGLLVASCIGEDIEGGPVELSIESNNLFSLGVNETNNGVLQLKTSLDENDNFRVFWESSNPEVIDVSENGRLIASTDENQIGKSATITANAFGLDNEGNIDNDTQVTMPQPRVVRLGKITINTIDVAGISEAELEELVEFGFEEGLNKTQALSSVDVSDKTQQLRVSFVNFMQEVIENPTVNWSSSNSNILSVNPEGVLNPLEKSDEVVSITATLPAESTSKGVALQQIFEITVSDETAVEAPVDPPVNEKTLIGSGSFQANNGYNSRGGFQIFRDSNGVITLEVDADFSAPIPERELYASNTTSNDISNATLIAKDYSSRGAQTFDINFDITTFKYVYIYCASVRRNAGFGEIK